MSDQDAMSEIPPIKFIFRDEVAILTAERDAARKEAEELAGAIQALLAVWNDAVALRTISHAAPKFHALVDALDAYRAAHEAGESFK
jgi:hypothetical protein